jgi:hypothetical protein
MPDAAVAGEIQDRHLAFRVTRIVIDALRSRGAGPRTVAALETFLPPPPTIDDFHADREIVLRGESATVHWSVSGAERVSLAPGFGMVPFVGQKTLRLTEDMEVTLAAEGPGGSTSRTIRIAVTSPPPPVIRLFRPEREAIKQGESVVVRWFVTGATRVRIDPDFSALPLEGLRMVGPDQTTQYTLTAEGPGGSSTRTIVIRVLPNTKDATIHEAYGERAIRLPVSGNLWRLIVPADRAFHSTGFQVDGMFGFVINPITPGTQFVLRIGNRDLINKRSLQLGDYVEAKGDVWIQVLESATSRTEFRVQFYTQNMVRQTGQVMVAVHKHSFGSSCSGEFTFADDALTFTSHSHTLRFSRGTIKSIFNGINAPLRKTRSGKLRGGLPSGWTTIVDTNGKRSDFLISGKTPNETQEILGGWLLGAR